MSKIVEQIAEGKIVLAEDSILTSKEMNAIWKKYFEKSVEGNYSILLEEFNLKILFNPIGYLGADHPIFKKKISIPKSWKADLDNQNVEMFGIYHFKDTLLFIHFKKEEYLKNGENFPAIHINSSDLLNGLKNGIFSKIDTLNNQVNVISQENIKEYIQNISLNKKYFSPEVLLIEELNTTLPKHWNLNNSFKEMFGKNISNISKLEWIPFYFKYKLRELLEGNQALQKIATMNPSITDNDIESDIQFLKEEFLASIQSSVADHQFIIGHKKLDLEQYFSTGKKLWYILLTYLPENEDQEHKSGSNAVLEDIILDKIQILSIPVSHKDYLSDIKIEEVKKELLVVNNPPIKIHKKDIINFCIYQYQF